MSLVKLPKCITDINAEWVADFLDKVLIRSDWKADSLKFKFHPKSIFRPESYVGDIDPQCRGNNISTLNIRAGGFSDSGFQESVRVSVRTRNPPDLIFKFIVDILPGDDEDLKVVM